jgi:hypothetical protein
LKTAKAVLNGSVHAGLPALTAFDILKLVQTTLVVCCSVVSVDRGCYLLA